MVICYSSPKETNTASLQQFGCELSWRARRVCHCCRRQRSQSGFFLPWYGLRESYRRPWLGEVNQCLEALSATCEDGDALRNSGLNRSRGSWRGQSDSCGVPSLPFLRPFLLHCHLPSLPPTFPPSTVYTLLLITLKSPFSQIKRT